MKILILSDAWHPQVNGVVRTYENITEQLTLLGHDVKVVGPEDFPLRISMPSYPEIKLAICPRIKLKKIIEAFAPDHIHIAVEGPIGWAGRAYCLKHKRPFTTSYHTQFPDYVAKRFAKHLKFLYPHIRKLGVKFVYRFHKPSSGIYVATQSLEDELNSYNFPAPKIRLLRGVQYDIFGPEGETVLEDIPKPIALYVGRISIEKNLKKFLDMKWEGSKVLVGDGPSMGELKKHDPKALFVGKKTGKELASYYRSSDIFVFPSKTDTFGIVLLEAFASGLPVAAYPVTGPIDLITDDFLGTLDEDLSTAAERVMEEETPERKTQRLAHVRANYSWPNVAQQFLSGFKDFYS
ncbi:MAG: glycosyltransferase family 4 protein [Bdellovibrionales bacterium]